MKKYLAYFSILLLPIFPLSAGAIAASPWRKVCSGIPDSEFIFDHLMYLLFPLGIFLLMYMASFIFTLPSWRAVADYGVKILLLCALVFNVAAPIYLKYSGQKYECKSELIDPSRLPFR